MEEILKQMIKEAVREAIREERKVRTRVPIEKVAEHYNVSTRTIKIWINEGLKHRKKGKNYFVYWEDVNSFLDGV